MMIIYVAIKWLMLLCPTSYVQHSLQRGITFSCTLCVPWSVPCQHAGRTDESIPVPMCTRPQGGQVHYTDAAAGTSNDHWWSLAKKKVVSGWPTCRTLLSSLSSCANIVFDTTLDRQSPINATYVPLTNWLVPSTSLNLRRPIVTQQHTLCPCTMLPMWTTQTDTKQ